MKYGIVFPGGPARAAAEFAAEAEAAGWDGFFVSEPVWGIDAWVTLAAVAMRTERIRLGTMLSPLSRMRPWKLAGETVALDHLSNGRLILSVGLGATGTGFGAFGEAVDRKTRAELLDEGLDILTGLWRGQPFRYDGKHYHVRETAFFPPPPPVQQPRIPIWVAAGWPRAKSVRRALRYDGLLPIVIEEGGQWRASTPADITAMKTFVEANRADAAPFDIVIEGTTPGEHPQRAGAAARTWADAGATWWIESMWSALDHPDGLRSVLQRIRQGPPRFE